MLKTWSDEFDPEMRRGVDAFDGRPTASEAEAAVRTLIRWAGDDPGREGLRDTPARVVKAYNEWFAGYRLDPEQLLSRTFHEVGRYEEMVLLKDIPVRSFCEHHMAAIRGVAHVAYIPKGKVVGISKLARLVEAHSRRLQVQERLTSEIAASLMKALGPRGVGVIIQATHDCMSSRGVNTPGVSMATKALFGALNEEPLRSEFLREVGVR